MSRPWDTYRAVRRNCAYGRYAGEIAIPWNPRHQANEMRFSRSEAAKAAKARKRADAQANG